MNQVEDEYHFLLVCPYYRDLRLIFLPNYYNCHWPSITKFENIFEASISYSQSAYFGGSLKLCMGLHFDFTMTLVMLWA